MPYTKEKHFCAICHTAYDDAGEALKCETWGYPQELSEVNIGDSVEFYAEDYRVGGGSTCKVLTGVVIDKRVQKELGKDGKHYWMLFVQVSDGRVQERGVIYNPSVPTKKFSYSSWVYHPGYTEQTKD